MKKCFSNTVSWIRRELSISQSTFFFYLINKFAVTLLTCFFALGGAAIGAIAGAIKGQTTEIGLLRGFTVGAMAGVLIALQFMDIDFITSTGGEPFSKVALISSLINGKIFMEWVSPAVLKAYQWQVSAMDTSLEDFSDIFDINTLRGLSQDRINELPVFEYNNNSIISFSCAICLQDMKDGESGRWLPKCKHMFHLQCLDQWLILQGTCPICRKDVTITC